MAAEPEERRYEITVKRITENDDGAQFIRLSRIGLFFGACAVLALVGWIRGLG